MFIFKSGGFVCFYLLLVRYFLAVSIDLSVCLFVYIFRIFNFVKKGNLYILGFRKLSYIRCRELIKESFLAKGINFIFYSIYSFRLVGVIFIVDNFMKLGVFDRLLMFYGRWKLEKVKNMYVKDFLESRL